MILLDRRQTQIFGTIALKYEEQDPNHEEDTCRNNESEAPTESIRAQSGQHRGDESAESIIGAPEAHDAAAFALRKKFADILRKRRPTTRLTDALDSE